MNWYASTEELVQAARALGKSDLAQVDQSDLVALTPEMAAVTGVPLAYRPAVRTRAEELVEEVLTQR